MADIEVTNHGTVVAFRVVSDGALDWINANLETEPWQWMGDSLVVDHGYAGFLVDLFQAEAGLEVN